MVLLGCGKKAPEQQANVPDANPPAQPPSRAQATTSQAQGRADRGHVDTGDGSSLKADEAGNYREAARLYTVELAAEEAKPAPSWLQLSYLHNELGRALDNAGL